jgi:hypothetical protein
MTTITPFADSARTAMKLAQRSIAERVAAGRCSTFEGELTMRMLEATVLAVSDMLDRHVDPRWIVGALGRAHGNAVMSALLTLTQASREAMPVALDQFSKNFAGIVDELTSHEGGADVEVSVEQPDMRRV